MGNIIDNDHGDSGGEYDDTERKRGDCNEIVPGIYLGNAAMAKDRLWLLAHGIDTIIDVGANNKPYHDDICKYYIHPILDHPEEYIPRLFPQIFEVLDENQRLGRGTLVHCYAGVSRSASVVIGYLISRYGMSYPDALVHVQNARDVVNPNVGFRKQLIEFEAQHKNKQQWDTYRRFEKSMLLQPQFRYYEESS